LFQEPAIKKLPKNCVQIFDVYYKTFDKWPPPPIEYVNSACMVSWKDSFLLFGGKTAEAMVVIQRYNRTSKTWSTVDASTAPIRCPCCCSRL
jgi:hypothetical protein